MTPTTAMAAQTQNPWVKAASKGSPRGVLFAVMTAAITEVPMLPPMVRVMALMLIASPV